MSAVTRCLMALVMLAACAPKPVQEASFRDTSRQVYSIAGLDPARINGHWVQVAGFGGSCRGGTMEIGPTTNYALCLPGGVKTGAGPMTASLPGRFDVPGLGPFWVLWADADDRTLVVGAPAGRYGFVLNREVSIPPDRLKAARDILQFNGYDVAKLSVY